MENKLSFMKRTKDEMKISVLVDYSSVGGLDLDGVLLRLKEAIE